MTTKDYLDIYISKFGTDYPQSSDAFYAFCDIVVKSDDNAIAGELKEGYDSTPINNLVNYIRGKSKNVSSIDFEQAFNSKSTQLIDLLSYAVNKNGGTSSIIRIDFSYLLDENIDKSRYSDDVVNLVYKLFNGYKKPLRIIEDRWKGFKISNKRGIDTLARL